MTSDPRDYVRYRVERSEEALRAATRAFDEDDLSEAVGRLYYSCFHLVTALLYTKRLSPTRHGGVWSMFDLNWMAPGRLPREMGRFFHSLYKRRHHADYGDFVVFERSDVQAWFGQAKDFSERISSEIEEYLSRNEPDTQSEPAPQ